MHASDRCDKFTTAGVLFMLDWVGMVGTSLGNSFDSLDGSCS